MKNSALMSLHGRPHRSPTGESHTKNRQFQFVGKEEIGPFLQMVGGGDRETQADA